MVSLQQDRIAQNNILFSSRNGFLLFLIVFNLIFFLLWNYTMDDAFITFKYASNFADYFKPYYNLNSDFQGDGQTSFLWFIVLTIPFLLKISPIIFYNIVNYCLSIVLLYTFSKNPLEISNQRWVNIIFKYFGGVFFSILLAINAKHGLETILYIYVLFLLLKNWNSKNNLGTLFSVLIFLIRPEGIVFSGIYALSLWRNKKIFWKNAFIVAGSLALFIGYKIYFFNELIPLPFMFKSAVSLDKGDFVYFILFTALFFPIIFHSWKNKKYFYIFPLLFFLVYYAFGMERIMGTGYRFSFPLLAYLLIPIENKLDKISVSKKYIKIFEIAYIGSFLIVMMAFFRVIFFEMNSIIEYTKGMENAHIKIGKSLSKNPNSKIFVSDAGAIAYYSKADCYDTFGLNDALFLKYRKDNNWKAYFNHADKINADYLILLSETPDVYTPKKELDFENKLYKHYNLHIKDLHIQRKFGDNYYVQVYNLKHL
ncbi:hypothetical protein [Chryseobacterium oryzae]|uniref:Glycosyltransferase RgtA/B/C/D-like domain-containing protein n=1 Tax=Chryseobacterium oryzae TaxID=2929799 RepID=A0ABY4BFV8_9FLAO|nr:hypothetical protein [Chryseobacterium oryzae]UOE37634.1 hypothetical protein MTP08_11270 [Chryseobacterium oryzae]